jgi:Flp pilus assembly protein TadD
MKTIRRSYRAIPICVLLPALLLAGCSSTGEERPDERGDAAGSVARTIEAGDRATSRGDHQTALLLYRQAIEKGASRELWLRIAGAETARDNPDGALGAWLKVLELDPENVMAAERAGLIYLRKRKLEPAATHMKRAAASQRAGWRTHNGLGVLADIQGEHEAAVSHYQAALEQQPDSAIVRNNLGYSLFLSGDREAAERTFGEVLEQGAYEPATMNLALLYADRREYRRAVSLLSTVVSAASAHNDIGFIAMTNEDFDGAEWLFSEAIRRSPVHYVTAQRNLAMNRTLAAGRVPDEQVASE